MSTRPVVLFVCVHNAGRSQMAAGWLRHLAGDTVEIRSAGSEPADRINPIAVEAMREVGVDITGRTPTLLDHDTARESDVIVTMGCGDTCPLPRQALRGLETRRPRRAGSRRRPPHPGPDPRSGDRSAQRDQRPVMVNVADVLPATVRSPGT